MGRVAAKRELLIALVMALGLGAGRATWAQEEMAIDNFAGVGIRAMGMGGAFAAVADDFTAVFWNPLVWLRSNIARCTGHFRATVSTTRPTRPETWRRAS